MTLEYLLRRIGVFLLVVWGAATFNFILPRMADVNPIEERMSQLASRGAVSSGNTEAMIKNFEKRFGLDQPLYEQYLRYLWNFARFDFGFSVAFFPTQVRDVIAQALPWTLILVTISSLIYMFLGMALGALVAWPGASGIFKFLFPPVMSLSAIPYYLVGVALIHFLAFQLDWFPLGGGYKIGTSPEWSWDFIQDASHHAVLPALSIILVSIGFSAIGMRGMMVTTQGEDYMLLAEAKGTKPWRLFAWYGVRNAMLPQVTSFALTLGQVVSGVILVEVVFSYPGIGTLASAGDPELRLHVALRHCVSGNTVDRFRDLDSRSDLSTHRPTNNLRRAKLTRCDVQADYRFTHDDSRRQRPRIDRLDSGNSTLMCLCRVGFSYR